MSWFTDYIHTLTSFHAAVTLPVFVDLGSSRTRVMSPKHLLYDQPTCCTYAPVTQDVIEVGDRALQTGGGLPTQVKLFFPIQRGVLTHRLQTQLYLTAVLKRSTTDQQRRVFLAANGLCAIPSSLSPVEKKTLTKVLQQSGWGGVKLVPKSEALYAVLQAKQGAHPSIGIIDIGAETTEVAFFHRSQLVVAATIPLGGKDYTDAVKTVVNQAFHTTISTEVAEQIKHNQREMPFWSASDTKKAEFKIPFRSPTARTGCSKPTNSAKPTTATRTTKLSQY